MIMICMWYYYVVASSGQVRMLKYWLTVTSAAEDRVDMEYWSMIVIVVCQTSPAPACSSLSWGHTRGEYFAGAGNEVSLVVKGENTFKSVKAVNACFAFFNSNRLFFNPNVCQIIVPCWVPGRPDPVPAPLPSPPPPHTLPGPGGGAIHWDGRRRERVG